MTIAIEAQDLGKTFRGKSGTKTAISGLTFQVETGASLGIVGGSGAGKTTVASLLMGFIEPSTGTVLIDGQPRPRQLRGRSRSEWARRIQIVFQDPYSSFDPHQRLGEAIDEVLRHHYRELDRRGRRTRIAELFSAVGLAETLTDERARSLSGGQLQRVAIARALALDPRILILDEPVAALDVSVQAQILNLLQDLRERLGLTYVMISHDLGVIRYSTDQLLVLRAGSVVESGTTSSVLDAAREEYTRLLVRAAP